MNTNLELFGAVTALPEQTLQGWQRPDHVVLIAEVGINHNGDLDIAKRLIDLAVQSGCDAVKFQKRTIDIVYSPEILDQPRESPWGSTQRAQKEGLEFGKTEYDEIDRYCRSVGMPWSASAWDIPSLEFVESYDPPFHKLASAMLSHADFVNAVAALGRPTYISTGMSDFELLDGVVEVFRSHGTPFILLHTVSTYPSPDENLNLLVMNDLRERYGVPVGYSGHESSVSPSLVAVVLGACVIERHITLDRAMYGSDQAASLEPFGLRQLVGMARKVPAILGDGVKTWAPGEESVAAKLRYWNEP